MIYSIQCSGQMCNRILWFAHALATAIDLKANILHPFGKEIRSFSDLNPEAIPEIKIRCFNWGRCIPVDVLHGWMLNLPGMREKYTESCVNRCRDWREQGRKNLLLWNWHFRNTEAIARHREKIVAFLRAKALHCARPNKIIGRLRDDGVIVVGVHIRRGDYKTAMPQFYYDDATYLRIMRELTGSLGDRVKFVAVSNEPVDMAFFRAHGLDLTEASGTPQEDVVTLSLCDYIVGPPSTFSWWAAYYGDKPRLSLRNRDDEVSLDKFAKVAALTSRLD